jgi:hypothetical protein
MGIPSGECDCNSVIGDGTPHTYDCIGYCGHAADDTFQIVDNCDVCDADPTNDCTQDCLGVWGGTAVIDVCNVCDGGEMNVSNCGQCPEGQVLDCSGVCNGDSYLDDCGICNSTPLDDCKVTCPDNITDCSLSGGSWNDEDFQCWGGYWVLDECLICMVIGGNGIPNGDCDCHGNQLDCMGSCGGDAVIDNCNICSYDVNEDGGSLECAQDCLGIWGGIAIHDNCGTCDTDVSNDCVQDCLGEWGGNAQIDECGICYELASGDTKWNTTCADCAGTPNGSATTDECGICNGDNSSCTTCI